MVFAWLLHCNAFLHSRLQLQLLERTDLHVRRMKTHFGDRAFFSAQWRIPIHLLPRGGGKSGHGSHGSCQWSLAPLGDRKSNDSIVNLSKCKDFGPPVSMSATDLAPYAEKYHIITWKKSMTKKKYPKKFREIDILGKCRNFFGKRLKKVVQKFQKNLAPVSKVLDPPVIRECSE